MIVVSESEAMEYGCPHCNYSRAYRRMSGGNTTIYSCSNKECQKGYYVVVDGETCSSWNDHPPVVPHPRPVKKWPEAGK